MDSKMAARPSRTISASSTVLVGLSFGSVTKFIRIFPSIWKVMRITLFSHASNARVPFLELPLKFKQSCHSKLSPFDYHYTTIGSSTSSFMKRGRSTMGDTKGVAEQEPVTRRREGGGLVEV